MMAVLVGESIDEQASGDWAWRWYTCGVELADALPERKKDDELWEEVPVRRTHNTPCLRV